MVEVAAVQCRRILACYILEAVTSAALVWWSNGIAVCIIRLWMLRGKP